MSILPFGTEPHPVWSLVAQEIHTVVWDHMGLEKVQAVVRDWAEKQRRAQDQYEQERAACIAERTHAESLAVTKSAVPEIAENWSESLEIPPLECYRLLPPSYLTVLFVKPFPREPELPLPLSHRARSIDEKWAALAAIHDVYWMGGDKINPSPPPEDEKFDLERWKRWVADSLAFSRLLERAGGLADTDHPVIARWLKDAIKEDATPGEATTEPPAPPAGSEDQSKQPTAVDTEGQGTLQPESQQPPAGGEQKTKRPCRDRDKLFLQWYESEDTKTYHSHAEIRNKWNTMSKDERTKICPSNPNNVTRSTAIAAIKAAKRDRAEEEAT